ncbi:hypothetical protein DNU06_12740 [Putridiphycobacter roseus]|uniref:Uncharacterized protein n=1 Tax=Putridiphycobacter roseus TaxID=2219161 RepID=A0A2W1NL76_9FLAO|nr:hypothetical protein [Putridiphycobacter roseus]PZE16412.1 hypothetical protein DNU06_12740 [Putridiphycobacter roseus]
MKRIVNFIGLLLTVVLVLSMQRTVSEKSYDATAFRIIKVNGNIYFISSGVDLKTGGVYVEGTPIGFSTKRDRAAIVNGIRGRFILQPSPKGKAIVLPATNNIKPRSGGSALINYLDVVNFFSDTCVFIGPVNVKLGKETFPLNESHFLYVTYPYGEERIAKKLMRNGQTVLLDEASLFEIDGKRVATFETEMTLYYKKGESVTKLSTFYPVFPKEALLNTEVTVLLEGVKDLTKEKQIDEVAAFITEFYGKPQKDNLNAWLEKEFALGLDKNINFK